MLVLSLGCSASRVESTVEAEMMVAVAANRSSVVAGQDLQITVTATNGASAARTLQFSSGCFTDFEFLDSSGRVVGASLQMCVQVLTQKTVAPGASFSDSHTWTRGPLGFPQLAPGSYQLRGVLLTMPTAIRSSSIPVTIP
jgi:hypothetical protein